MMGSKKIKHPGEILWKEFIQPANMTAIDVARACLFTQGRISDIIRGKRKITADTAIRFGLFFGNSAAYWCYLQMAYDISIEEKANSKIYKKIKPLAK